jgi:outer membrane protein assembly factor BamB
LNLQTGELIWTFKDKGMCLYAPIVTEKAIYICGSNTPLSTLNIETGKTSWAFQSDVKYL